jgi:hypothetical protein
MTLQPRSSITRTAKWKANKKLITKQKNMIHNIKIITQDHKDNIVNRSQAHEE